MKKVVNENTELDKKRKIKKTVTPNTKPNKKRKVSKENRQKHTILNEKERKRS